MWAMIGTIPQSWQIVIYILIGGLAFFLLSGLDYGLGGRFWLFLGLPFGIILGARATRRTFTDYIQTVEILR